MEASQVSLNKVTLNVSSSKDGGVSLNKGEMVKGTVQEVKPDGSVTIVIKGKVIEAVTEVPIKPGQELYLMVDDFRNGKTYLKVVSPEMMGKIENANITANLVEMGVPAKEENVLLASKLVQHNLPVTPESLNELARDVKLLGGNNPKNLEIAAFALSRGISSREALTALANFLAPEANVAKLVPVLNNILDILAAQAPGAAAPQTESVQTAPVSITPSVINTDPEPKPSATIPTPVTLSASDPESAAISMNDKPALQATNIAEEAALAQPGESKPATPTANTVQGKILSAAPPGTSVLQPNNDVNKAGLIAAINGEEAASAIPLPSKSAADVLQPSNITEEVVSMPTPGESTRTSEAVILAKTPNVILKGESTPQAANAFQETTSTSPASGEVAMPGMRESRLTGPGRAEAVLPEMNGGQGVSPAKDENSSNIMRSTPVENESGGTSQIAKKEASAETPRVKLENILNPISPNTEMNEPENTSGITNSKTGINQPITEDTLLAKTGLDSVKSANNLTQKFENLLKSLLEIMELDPAASSNKIAEKLQHGTQSEREVIKALFLLEDISADKRMGDKISPLRDLPLRLDNMGKEISGQRLFNLSTRSPGDNFPSYYYFSYPVKMEDGYSLCQLKINKDARKNLKNMDNLNFVVSLNTNKMGTVLFHVNWQRQGNIKLQGVVENQTTCNHLNRNMEKLVSKLQELGFNVSNLGVKVSASPAEINSVKPGIEEAVDHLRPLGIDVTV